jgi:phospholipase/carboxylesterase
MENSTNLEIKHTKLAKWRLRLRVPDGEGPHPVILMLHGWTGDENAMWIFSSRMPINALLIAPRGLHETPLGGFGWHSYQNGVWPMVDDFRPSVTALTELLAPENFPELNIDTTSFSSIRIVGFSQGAALAFSFALLYPELVKSIAGLSGFLPEGSSFFIADKPLNNKQVFLAHGTYDKLVPVQRARSAVDILRKAGADVIYCEDDVGHKLSVSCFRGMESFFAKG